MGLNRKYEILNKIKNSETIYAAEDIKEIL